MGRIESLTEKPPRRPGRRTTHDQRRYIAGLGVVSALASLEYDREPMAEPAPDDFRYLADELGRPPTSDERLIFEGAYRGAMRLNEIEDGQ